MHPNIFTLDLLKGLDMKHILPFKPSLLVFQNIHIFYSNTCFDSL